MSFEDQIKYVGYLGKSPKPATVRKVATDIKKLYEQIYDIDQNFHWKKYQVMLMDPEVLLEGLDEMKGRKDAQISLNTRIGYLQSCLIGLKSFGLQDSIPYQVLNEVFMEYQTERIVEDKKNPPTLQMNRQEIETVVEKHKNNLKKWISLSYKEKNIDFTYTLIGLKNRRNILKFLVILLTLFILWPLFSLVKEGFLGIQKGALFFTINNINEIKGTLLLLILSLKTHQLTMIHLLEYLIYSTYFYLILNYLT